MEFLRSCAKRLDQGECVDSVLKDMRERYTTARCMSVKTCLVRSLCTPSPEYVRAVEALLMNVSEEDHDLVKEALDTGKRVPEQYRDAVRRLPPRLPENSWRCRITRKEGHLCKRLQSQSAMEKNRKRLRVDAREMLHEARKIVAEHETCEPYIVALAVMMLTGRRTCEMFNGKSCIRTDAERVGPPHWAVVFEGQAKRRRGPGDSYIIPVLTKPEHVCRAWAWLRETHIGTTRSNRDASTRFQSSLRRCMREHPVFSQAKKVHALRGLYACMSLRLFDWGEASDAYVAMCILGHNSLKESLVYTPFDLGREFSEEPRLGDGLLTQRRSTEVADCVGTVDGFGTEFNGPDDLGPSSGIYPMPLTESRLIGFSSSPRSSEVPIRCGVRGGL